MCVYVYVYEVPRTFSKPPVCAKLLGALQGPFCVGAFLSFQRLVKPLYIFKFPGNFVKAPLYRGFVKPTLQVQSCLGLCEAASV